MKVGRIALAATLILAGGGILADNLLGIGFSWYIARLWPAVLILLGLEWVWASSRTQEEGRKVSVDGGAIVGLIIVALVASSVSSWNWGRSPFSTNRHISIQVPRAPFGFGSISAESSMEQGLDLKTMQELVITSSSASITVQDGPAARVELITRAWGFSQSEAQGLANQSQLRVENGRVTTVKANYPGGTNVRVEHQFIVTLPRDAKLVVRANSASGAIAIMDRTGDVWAESSSGSVRAENIKGNVDARTSSGSFSGKEIDGNLAVTSSSGAVRVERVFGDVKANSTSGSVVVREAGGKVTAQASSGSVTIESDQVGGDYDLQAVSGSVRLEIPSAAGVTVNAKASSGTVSGPSWLTIGEGRNSGSGQQGSGQYKVEIRTSSGSIRVDVD